MDSDPLYCLLGVPFKDGGRDIDGLDCWGLYRRAIMQCTSIVLPSYDDAYISTEEVRENAALIAGKLDSWDIVKAGDEARLDAILLRVGKHVSHIAMVVKPGYMLHTYSGGAACIDRYRTGPFRNRVSGFYRLRAIQGSPATG